MTVICILLFIGAMGKSAQFPLHVWLPDSMEGPTPISALIHAATMVTAGIFMVARMSPLFELSDMALSFVMVIGAITALFMGFLGIVQNDIKRVVAYSTLSQLGYMTVALGASAYSVAVFHLMTHAFFKALLFLGGRFGHHRHAPRAGHPLHGRPEEVHADHLDHLADRLAGADRHAVLVGLLFQGHASSRRSGCRTCRWPTSPTWRCCSACSSPPSIPSACISWCSTARSVSIRATPTATSQMTHHGHGGTPHETPWVVTGPLLVLAIPSLAIGYMTIEPMLFGDYFGNAIYVADRHPVMHELDQHFHGAAAMGLHAVMTLPFWLAVAGVGLSAFFYLKRPDIPAAIAQRFRFLHQMLLNKYWFDELYDWFFAEGARVLGGSLWRRGDQNLIDGFFVNGTVHLVERASRLLKAFQSGYIYHYAFAMMIGVFALVTWFARLN